MDGTILGKLTLEGGEEVTIEVVGTFERYSSDPADAYIVMRDKLVKSTKEEKK